MTKTLTEQFMNNELDDRLYYFTQKMSQDKVEIGHSFEFNMVRADDGEYLDSFLINEVLAPVPSYDEYKRLQELLSQEEDRIGSLLERIGEADKIIKYYAEKHGKLKACDYLNKWGVK